VPRASFYTLGCKLNYAETSTLARDFEAHTYDVVPFGEPADVTVINTCTVTKEADRKCRQIIRRALRANPEAFIIVTGCYAQLQPGRIAGMPGVDVVLGSQEKFRLFHLIETFSKGEDTQVAVSCIDDAAEFGPAFSSGERTRAFLKVQDGCNYSCAFCTIPLARGKSRSQSIEATAGQVRELAARGFREVVLSGVNIGLYGQEHGIALLDLLRELDRVEGIERYRISSIEPNLLTDEIIDFVVGSRAFQPHFHLPLQSGSNAILGKMRRRYRRDRYTGRVARIKDRMPHACIGVDVIVGFPGETEAYFEETYEFLRGLPASYFHVFTYSERANTVAVDTIETIGTPVPPHERSHRNRMLRILSEKKRRQFFRNHQGQDRPVLWEGENRNGMMHGFTDNYIKVRRPYAIEMKGAIETVRLGPLTEDGCVESQSLLSLPLV